MRCSEVQYQEKRNQIKFLKHDKSWSISLTKSQTKKQQKYGKKNFISEPRPRQIFGKGKENSI